MAKKFDSSRHGFEPEETHVEVDCYFLLHCCLQCFDDADDVAVGLLKIPHLLERTFQHLLSII